MMKHGFDMHRLFISGPGDLERERDAVRTAISEANAEDAMPHKILLVSAGLREDDQIVNFRAAVSQNVRDTEYYIQIFEDDWGPKNLFRKTFYLALECRDDAAMPMREVVVFLKNARPETDPEIIAFRDELLQMQGIRLYQFKTTAELGAQMRELCALWVRDIQSQPVVEAEAQH